MEKVKSFAKEHKYGLVCFLFLVAYSLLFKNGVLNELDTTLTYSIYTMDYSVGFCTRVLPGVIYNLIFDELNTKNVTVYYYMLIALSYIPLSYLAEKFFKALEKTNGKVAVLIALFIPAVYCCCSFVGDLFTLLDFYWLLSMLLFFVFISNKKLYPFIPAVFLFAIMCHSACALSYIPMFVLVLLYKVICCEDKKERRILIAVLTVSFVSSVSLFFYMQLFETGNLNYTAEEFHKMMTDKGATYTDYIEFPFFKDVYDENSSYKNAVMQSESKVIDIDYSKSPLSVLIQTVVLQIQINLIVSNHTYDWKYCVAYIPLVLFIIRLFIERLVIKDINKGKKFIYVNSVLLFFFVLASGLLLSTDTTRWIGHAVIILFSVFAYMLTQEEAFAKRTVESVESLSPAVVLIYLFVFFNAGFYI